MKKIIDKIWKYLLPHIDGHRTLRYDNGTKYIGELKAGIKSGHGAYTWADGTKYVGEWKDDKPNGQGTHTFADGRIYEGVWENGEFIRD